MRTGRKVLAFVTAAFVVCGGLAIGPTAAEAATRLGVSKAAADYAKAHGYRVGIAIMDTKTGAVHGEGYSRSAFASESVVKVFIAARLIVQGRMHGTTAKRAYKMITQSDDAIASSFYGSVGGDSLINWVKKYFHQPNLGSPPRRAGWWGNTHITAIGLVELYGKLKKNKKIGPWLLNAMHHATKHGSDGQYQYFGLASATTNAAVKQGWGADYDDWFNSADFNSTGFVNGDRYAIAILARGPISTYGSKISNLLTHVAQLLLPGGTFPPPSPAISWKTRLTGPSSGGTAMTIHGSDFTHVTSVQFGTLSGINLSVLSSTALQVTAPPHPAGTVSIRVYTDHGASSVRSIDNFTYIDPPTLTGLTPAAGPTSGGQTLTITGTNFQIVQRVLFGPTAGTKLTVLSPTKLTVVTPAHDRGVVDVQVDAAYGVTPVVPAGRYTFSDIPAVVDGSPQGAPSSLPSDPSSDSSLPPPPAPPSSPSLPPPSGQPSAPPSSAAVSSPSRTSS